MEFKRLRSSGVAHSVRRSDLLSIGDVVARSGIAELARMRDDLTGCIGCGVLELPA
ncbi:MAG TPA: hypothetical protein VFP41_11290 [Actinomycetota bacterium]|nr:hypothetical protein [Actinomycetota bacterium]